MTLAELRQEVIDRGYDYVTAARISKFLQRAYVNLCQKYPWYFIEGEATGTPPLTITDLGRVLSVSLPARDSKIRGADRRWILTIDPALNNTGYAEFWYLEESGTLKVWPAEAAAVTVRYLKRPAELGDDDEPLIPEEWQYLLVDMAIVNCLRDDDEYAEARALKLDNDAAFVEMVQALARRNYQDEGFIVRTGRPGDYL